jgi:hypothetical protein
LSFPRIYRGSQNAYGAFRGDSKEGKMNAIESAVRILNGQTVRMDIVTRWPNNYKINRSLIGIVVANDYTFYVEESFPGGTIVVEATYKSVYMVRIDSDPAGFQAVISIDTTVREDLDE